MRAISLDYVTAQTPDHIPGPFIDLLFFGDIVGKPGRMAVKAYLSLVNPRPDVVIANVENVTHGLGLNERHYQELMDMGVHIMTGGNHIWDRQDIFKFVDSIENLVRPANFNQDAPGVGARVIAVNGVNIGVINLIGQVFMGNYNSPWEAFDQHIAQLRAEAQVLFVDFHGEATAEKLAFAHYVSDKGISAMVGTHTHVQTADHRIMNSHMGYITDAGFNGTFHSVIGLDPESSIRRMRSQFPTKLEMTEFPWVQINAVRFRISTKTGQCVQVTPIREVYDLSDEFVAQSK